MNDQYRDSYILIDEEAIADQSNREQQSLLAYTYNFTQNAQRDTNINNCIGLFFEVGIFAGIEAYRHRQRKAGARNFSQFLKDGGANVYKDASAYRKASRKALIDYIDSTNYSPEIKMQAKNAVSGGGIAEFADKKNIQKINSVADNKKSKTGKKSRWSRLASKSKARFRTGLRWLDTAVQVAVAGHIGWQAHATCVGYNPDEAEATQIIGNLRAVYNLELSCIQTIFDKSSSEKDDDKSVKYGIREFSWNTKKDLLTRGQNYLTDQHKNLLKEQIDLIYAQKAPVLSKMPESAAQKLKELETKTNEQIKMLYIGADNEDLVKNHTSREQILNELKNEPNLSAEHLKIIDDYTKLINTEEVVLNQQKLLTNISGYMNYADYLSHNKKKSFLNGMQFTGELNKKLVEILTANVDYIFFQQLEDKLKNLEKQLTYTNIESKQEQATNKTLAQNAKSCHFEEPALLAIGNMNQNVYDT